MKIGAQPDDVCADDFLMIFLVNLKNA